VGQLLRILGHLFFVLVCQATLAAVVAVEVRRHENTSAAGLVRALPPQASDLAIVVHPVELQRRERVLLVLVRDLLRLGVVLRTANTRTFRRRQTSIARPTASQAARGGRCERGRTHLLLPLLATTTQPQHQVEG
jgi:hypothetical protein